MVGTEVSEFCDWDGGRALEGKTPPAMRRIARRGGREREVRVLVKAMREGMDDWSRGRRSYVCSGGAEASRVVSEGGMVG